MVVAGHLFFSTQWAPMGCAVFFDSSYAHLLGDILRLKGLGEQTNSGHAP